ncbi:MAG: hypothetical protein AAGE52_29835 [Myxococcota bacterium]
MRERFVEVASLEEFEATLRNHKLYREDDVTFDDLAAGKMYVYRGDDFVVDSELLESLDISALLIEGSIEAAFLSVGAIFPEIGVLCVTGDVGCKDMLCMTESTGMVVGGSLHISNAFYADCGNSVIQVNGNLTAKLFYNTQCSVDVHGEEKVELDESVSAEQLAALGINVGEDQDTAEAVEAYLDQLGSD